MVAPAVEGIAPAATDTTVVRVVADNNRLWASPCDLLTPSNGVLLSSLHVSEKFEEGSPSPQVRRNFEQF